MKYIYIIIAIIFGFVTLIYLAVSYVGILTPLDIPIVIEGTREYYEIKYQLIGQNVGPAIIIIGGILISSYFFSLYHRHNKRRKDTFDKALIKEPFVLYLRSFLDDKTTQRRISFVNDTRSEEEVLVEVMSDIAPVYAIGDPSDKKMPLGASRIYVDDEHWKLTVIDMMERAVLVVLRLGKTDSFWWEVETAVKKIPLQKVMFVIPESNTFSNVAMLYKILLEHNIDIKNLNVSIEKKNSGSISSFLFFDKNSLPITKDVKNLRFTRLALSYGNILRNSLSEFRGKFGLDTKTKRTLRTARLLEILVIVFSVFIFPLKSYTDILALKSQMPYEFVERCIENPNFVDKYSDKINGNNFVFGMIETTKGRIGLDDEKYNELLLIESQVKLLMSRDEFVQISAKPQNMLLMVKKYVPDRYYVYVNILAEAAIIAVSNPNEIAELLHKYKSNNDIMPQWLDDWANSQDLPEDEYELEIQFSKIIIEHINDENITDFHKTTYSKSITVIG